MTDTQHEQDARGINQLEFEGDIRIISIPAIQRLVDIDNKRIEDTSTNDIVQFTNIELSDAYDRSVLEADLVESENAEIESELAAYVFTRRNAIDGLKVLGVIANSTGVLLVDIYASFIALLVGSDLEDPIKEYVTKFSEPSITNFNPNTNTDAEKKMALRLTRDFIHSGVTVWIGKYLMGIEIE